jgi:hypothetical protein
VADPPSALRPSAIAAGALASTTAARVLHVAGDEYGVALALAALAWWLDHRLHWWLTRAILTAIAAGSVLCLPAVADLTTYLTGAHS